MDVKMAVSVAEVRDVPDKPFQPRHLSFPPRSFGKTTPVSGFFKHRCLIVLLGSITMSDSMALSVSPAARR